MSPSAGPKRRLLYLGVGLVLLVLAGRELLTHRGVGPASLPHGELEVRTLTGRVLYAPDELGLPIALAHVEGRLVVADAHLDPALHVLDADEGRPLAVFGARGEGPGEFRAPRSVLRLPERADAVWLYDIELQRLTLIDLAELPRAPGGRDVPTLHLRSGAPVTDPLFLPGPGTLVALGFFPEGRLGFFDAEGEQLGTGGPLPAFEGDVPPHVLQHAYQGSLASRPDGSLLAVASRHAGRLEILSPRGEPVRLAAVPFKFAPRFQIAVGSQGPTMASGPDLRFGYVHVAATRDRIYGLFSGRLRGAYPERAHLGRYIHAFDWEGRLLEVFELDEDAFALAASEDGGVLYTLRHLPVPGVARYELDAARSSPPAPVRGGGPSAAR